MEIFKDFAKKIATKEDLIFLLEEINLIQELIFKNINLPLRQRIKDKTSSSLLSAARIIEELEKKKMVSKNPEKNQTFFENFKKYLKNLPQIKILIAFRPRKTSIDKISIWLKKKVSEEMVLDLNYNPEVVGGAIVEYRGKRLDFSLAKKIDELF